MWKIILKIIPFIIILILCFFLFKGSERIQKLEQNLVNQEVLLEKAKRIGEDQLIEYNKVRIDLGNAQSANKKALEKEAELKDELDNTRDYAITLESKIHWLETESENAVKTNIIVIEEFKKTKNLVIEVLNINQSIAESEDIPDYIIENLNKQNEILNRALTSLNIGEENALGLDGSLRSILLKVGELEQINSDLQASLDLAKTIQADLRIELETVKASEVSALGRVDTLEIKTNEQQGIINEAHALNKDSQLQVQALKVESMIFKISSGIAIVGVLVLGGVTLFG